MISLLKNRFFLFTGMLLMILILSGSTAVAAETGTILVYIEPSDKVATVCVDDHCQNTYQLPEGQGAEFPGLDTNRYHGITVTLDGYQQYTQDVYLSSPGTQVVDAVLVPEQTGTILVYIEPSDKVATVCVDDHCQNTYQLPEGQGAEFPGLDTNSYHKITVTLDGYQQYTQDVYLTGPVTQVVDAVLVPLLAVAAPIAPVQSPAAPVSTSLPPTTKAGLSGLIVFLAVGITSLALLYLKR